MPKIVSTSTMIMQLEVVLLKGDLDERDADFVRNLAEINRAGQVTRLSDGQVNWLADLHERHFG